MRCHLDHSPPRTASPVPLSGGRCPFGARALVLRTEPRRGRVSALADFDPYRGRSAGLVPARRPRGCPVAAGPHGRRGLQLRRGRAVRRGFFRRRRGCGGDGRGRCVSHAQSVCAVSLDRTLHGRRRPPGPASAERRRPGSGPGLVILVYESTSCRDHARGALPGSAGILPAAGRRPAIVQAGKMPALPGRRHPNDDGASRCPGPTRFVSVKKNHRILVGASGPASATRPPRRSSG